MNSIRRTSRDVTVTAEWPKDWCNWENLTPQVRNRVRDALDEASDLIADCARKPE